MAAARETTAADVGDVATPYRYMVAVGSADAVGRTVEQVQPFVEDVADVAVVDDVAVMVSLTSGLVAGSSRAGL